jgi:hypothetical protein
MLDLLVLINTRANGAESEKDLLQTEEIGDRPPQKWYVLEACFLRKVITCANSNN